MEAFLSSAQATYFPAALVFAGIWCITGNYRLPSIIGIMYWLILAGVDMLYGSVDNAPLGMNFVFAFISTVSLVAIPVTIYQLYKRFTT